MSRVSFLQAVGERTLLADGAMGTQLMAAGLASGQSSCEWNLIHPDRVVAVHKSYLEAGCDLILTNTFQGCAHALARHGLAAKAYASNLNAARLARDCAGADGYVLGDIGPFGGFLSPLGNTHRKELETAFIEQAQALLDGGVDGIIIETMTALEELEVAVAAVRRCSARVPIVASLTFDRLADGGFHTMTGVGVPEAIEFMSDLGVDLFGCNCGTGLHVNDYIQLVTEMRRLSPVPIMVQPNAGEPRLSEGQIVYEETPGVMAAAVGELVNAGANIVGGCCGTTPEHLRLFRRELDRAGGRSRKPPVNQTETDVARGHRA